MDATSPFLSAVSLLCFTIMIVGFKSFTDPDTEYELKRGVSLYVHIVLLLIVVAGSSSYLNIGPLTDLPEALEPPETLRLGDSDYYRRAFSIEDIERGLEVVNSGGHIIEKSTLHIGSFLIFFLTVSLGYILLIWFNPRWNNAKVWSFVVLVVLLQLPIELRDQRSDESLDPSFGTAASILASKYPASKFHCTGMGYTEEIASTFTLGSATRTAEIARVGDIVFTAEEDVGFGGRLTSGTSTAAREIFHELTPAVYVNGSCDTPTGDWGTPCRRYEACISAASYNANQSDGAFSLLTKEQIKDFVD